MEPCPDCRHQNPARSKFCLECGAQLELQCPQCSTPLPASAKFCLECGTRIGAPAAPELAHGERSSIVDGERRHLTVLFCDLVDSTSVASQLGAEEWRNAVRRFQTMATRVVERFGGYVAQYLGDGLLVYFGYPQAHEDAPERAVRCGLGLIDALPRLNEEVRTAHGVAFSVRAGIHTGPVVVSEMGGGPRRETLALGDIPNLAARLQGLAEADTVVMSATTLRLVQGIFVTQDLGTRQIKGFEQPIRVHRALQRSGMRSRLDQALARNPQPLAGRVAELGLLTDRWNQAREGRGHAVAISGEPGIGKSRLVHAFRERLAESAHTWLECRGSTYTRDNALFPVLELHQQLLGFSADAPRDEKLERIETGLEAAGYDPAETAPILAALHGLEPPERSSSPILSPTGLRKRTLSLLADWLLRLGRQQPVVLLLEDVHWMDPSTQELLSRIMDEMQRSQVLLLLTHRADFEPTWPTHSHLTPLPLTPLGSAAVEELIRTVMSDRPLPDAWVREIARHSDGVPLFAEELTRSVLESHLPSAQTLESELRVPESLEDLLMARLDQLGPAKEVAQVGAVIGREFSYSLVRALWPAGEPSLLEALGVAVRKEYFLQRGAPPDAIYTFKHALIRDSAYQSLLRQTRRRCHEQVARALIAESPEVPLEQPELLAHHWSEAGEAELAITCWQRAGDLAVSRAANREAIRHLTQALAQIETLPEGLRRDARELAARSSLGHALVGARGWAHAETREAWERARALCDAKLDPLSSGTISCGLGDSYATGGELDEASRSFEAAGALGEESGQELLVIARHQGLAMVQHYQGRFREALQNVDAALAIYDPKRHRFLESGFYEEKGVNLLCWSAWICWQVGLVDRAWAMATRAVEQAREHRDPFALKFALTWSSITALLRRDWPEANRLGRESARLGAEQSFPMLEGLGSLTEVFSEGIVSGDPETSDRFLIPLGQVSATGSRLGVSVILSFHAELQLHVGRIEAAVGTLDYALSTARDAGQPCYDARLLELRGEALRRLPDPDEAEVERLFRSAVETAHGQHARSFELRAATRLGGFLHERGRGGEAAAILRPLYEGFVEGFHTPDLVEAKTLLDALG